MDWNGEDTNVCGCAFRRLNSLCRRQGAIVRLKRPTSVKYNNAASPQDLSVLGDPLQPLKDRHPMKKTLVATLCVFGLICGCATSANYNALLNTWINDSSDNLVARWGAPANVFNLNNGGKVFEYSHQNCITTGGYTYTVPQTTHTVGDSSVVGSGGYAFGTHYGTQTTHVPVTVPQSVQCHTCNTRFTVSNNGIIQAWSWSGNCKSR